MAGNPDAPITEKYSTVKELQTRASELLRDGYDVMKIYKSSEQGSVWQGYVASATGAWAYDDKRFLLLFDADADTSGANPDVIFES